PDLRLIRVGGDFTGPLERRLRNLGLQTRTTALPFLDRRVLAAVYRRAALVLLPSEREGFGLPVIEAIACGTPVVASDLGCLREVGEESVTYCAVGDVEAWADAVASLIREREKEPSRFDERRE